MGSSKGAIAIGLVVVVSGFAYWFVSGEGGSSLQQNAKLKAAEIVGQAARQRISDSAAGLEGTHGASVDLIKRPIEVRKITDDIYMATGVGNVNMITTPEGNVLFDTGLVIQAADQRKALRAEASEGPVTHVIISHSHADHVGGIKVWLDEGVEVIAHRELTEELRYLAELAPFQHERNRRLFPWLPEERPDLGFLDWTDIEPDVLVDADRDYTFEVGGKRFEVLNTPGAEGADNICLWLPEERILFSGDFFGPQFPQFPNVVTLRGEKVRKPIEYIRSLDRIIELRPAMIVPSHFNPTVGEEEIMASLVRTRDAVQYVHDETIAAMNAGKTVYQAMQEIQLPPHLDLPQNHGRVSWAVKTIWEYYGTWFHWDSTTELYPVPARDVYADVAEMTGVDTLLERARRYQNESDPVRALHLVEMALAGDPGNSDALTIRLEALTQLQSDAEEGLKNDYEIFWLEHRIEKTEEELGLSRSKG